MNIHTLLHNSLYLTITLGLLMFGAAPVMAQSVLEEVIVTAQKREQNLQDVPLSVTAISGDVLQANGVNDITRLEFLTPGLQFGQSGNDARPAIRGARTENVSVQQDPVIAFFVDGIYRGRTSQALAAFVDVSRVEVLRGPQGTLFGRNSFGGAISVISNQPEFENSYGADITIGNEERRRFEGFFNAPLSDTLALRITASVDQRDPFVDNTFDPDNGLLDKDETYIRAQLRWQASDSFDATLRASRWTQGGNGAADFGYFLLGRPVDLDGSGRISLDEALNGRTEPVNPRVGGGFGPADPDPYRIARDAAFDLDTEQETLDLELNWDVDFAAVKLLAGYADFSTVRTADPDLSVEPSAFEAQVDESESLSIELQLNSQSDGPLVWTVGAYYLEEDAQGDFLFDRVFNTDPATNKPILTSPAPTSDFNSRALVDTTSIAFYGQATYALTDRLRLTGGLRWTEDEKDFTRFVNFAFTNPINFGTTPSLEESATFDRVTWRAGLDFDVSENSLAYFTASTGFQSGGFNSAADAVRGQAAFDEQTLLAYEIGSKSTFAGGRVVLNLAAYLNEFEDLLANEFREVNNTVVTISTNAGEATVWGVEAELDWRPVDNALVNVRASLTDGEFDTFQLRDPLSGVDINLDGGPIALTPDYTLGVSGSYDFDLAGGGMLTPGVSVYFSDDFSTNDVNYNFARQSSYTKLDLRLTYTSANEAWYVEAFGRNVTDEEVITRTVIFGQGAIVQSFNEPATYGLRLGFRY